MTRLLERTIRIIRGKPVVDKDLRQRVSKWLQESCPPEGCCDDLHVCDDAAKAENKSDSDGSEDECMSEEHEDDIDVVLVDKQKQLVTSTTLRITKDDRSSKSRTTAATFELYHPDFIDWQNCIDCISLDGMRMQVTRRIQC